MIRQDFTVVIPQKSQKENDKGHKWEVRHAGLLGIKYEVAVRNDLFDQGMIKKEDDTPELGSLEVLQGVVEAAILGYVTSYPNEGRDFMFPVQVE